MEQCIIKPYGTYKTILYTLSIYQENSHFVLLEIIKGAVCFLTYKLHVWNCKQDFSYARVRHYDDCTFFFAAQCIFCILKIILEGIKIEMRDHEKSLMRKKFWIAKLPCLFLRLVTFWELRLVEQRITIIVNRIK